MISPDVYFAWGAAVVAVVVTVLPDWSEHPAINTAAMIRKQRNTPNLIFRFIGVFRRAPV
jgi:hypothetical protein